LLKIQNKGQTKTGLAKTTHEVVSIWSSLQIMECFLVILVKTLQRVLIIQNISFKIILLNYLSNNLNIVVVIIIFYYLRETEELTK